MNTKKNSSIPTNESEKDETHRQEGTSEASISICDELTGTSGNIFSSSDYTTDFGHHGMRDPPGQKCVYILPGDTYKETYRLSTYLKFPAIVPVDPCTLARYGFYYTGYKDRVKCFSCGACVQDWRINHNQKLARWHLHGCELVLGNNKNNEPIHKDRPIEFVGTFTASTPSLDCGYASRLGSSTMASTTSAEIRQSSTLLHLFPSYPHGGPTQDHMRVGFNSLIQSNGPHSRTQTLLRNTNYADMAHVFNELNIQNGYRQTAHLRANDISNSATVQGLQLASVTTSKHRILLTQILDLHKEADRIKSFDAWKCPAVSKEALAKSGFFYLGNLDRCQCFSCSGVLRNWRYGDDVHQEHQRHFAECNMMTNQEYRNVPLLLDSIDVTTPKLSGVVKPLDPSAVEALNLALKFSCLHSVNPHMKNLKARLQTFDGRWPSHQGLASARLMAKAGFFFLGEQDRVKCWYCNGGLQNWKPTDEPFTKHAKWFPTCEYVTRCKGVEFVRDIVAKFPNLQRPTLINARLNHQSRRLVNSSQEPPSIVDPQATRVSAGEVFQNFSPTPSGVSSEQPLLNGHVVSPMIQQVLDLGITNDKVQRALRVLQHQMIIPSCTDELLDVIFGLDTHSIPQLSSNAGASFRASPVSFSHSASTSLYSNDYIEHPHDPRPYTTSSKIETTAFLSTGFISIAQSLNPEFSRQMLSMGFSKEEIDFATTKKGKETGKGFESASEMVEFILQQRTPAHKPLPKNEQPQASYFLTPHLSPIPSISSLPPQSQPGPIGAEPQQSSTTHHETSGESNHGDGSCDMSVFIMMNGNERTAKMGLELLKSRHN